VPSDSGCAPLPQLDDMAVTYGAGELENSTSCSVE
jgi:hypothetical protein